jgi:sugar-specific transcriptional regulator TrmB
MSPDPSKLKREINLDPEAAEYNLNQLEDEEMMEVEEGYEQYQLIIDENDEPANDDSTDDEDTEDSDNEKNNEYAFQIAQEQEPSVPVIVSSSAELESQVWNAPRQEVNIEMSSETSQQITQIMKKINLPNPPAWVNEINTETLVNRLKNPK